MADSDFEDIADFDVNNLSNIMKDIDSANQALDAMEGRADKLTASIMSLLKAQSQPNPYINTESEPLDQDNIAATTTVTESLSITTPDTSSTLSVETEQTSVKVPPPSAASSSYSAEEKSA